MAIKKKQLDDFNKMLEKEDIFNLVNNVLIKHGLGDFEVGSMKVVAKTNKSNLAVVPICANGRPARRVITTSGNVKWICDD